MVYRIYLDVCCLNRPFDEQAQERIRLESEAILLILGRVVAGDWLWVGSEVMRFELDQMPDPDRRARVRLLTHSVGPTIVMGDAEVARGQDLERLGFHALDALHLACAEAGAVDVFLTTDDRLLRVSSRVAADLRSRVVNPLSWLREVAGT